MRDLDPAILEEKNKIATPNAWLVLLDVVVSQATTLYFVSNNEDITFNGHTYLAAPFDIDPVKSTSKGEIPLVNLRISRIAPIFLGTMRQYDGFVGKTVKITVVNSAHLAQDFSELEITMTVDSASAGEEWVTWSLGPINPLRMRFPAYRYLVDHCDWSFGSIECGLTPEEGDVCARTFDACQVWSNTARFGGFRGLIPKGWRVF